MQFFLHCLHVFSSPAVACINWSRILSANWRAECEAKNDDKNSNTIPSVPHTYLPPPYRRTRSSTLILTILVLLLTYYSSYAAHPSCASGFSSARRRPRGCACARVALPR